MQLVLDTNVVASGLLWDGKPAQLIDAARGGEAELATSRVLLAELTRILRRAKFAKAIATAGASLDDLALGYAELALLVTPASIPPTESHRCLPKPISTISLAAVFPPIIGCEIP